jgi:phage baseplate assembly protein gpV
MPVELSDDFMVESPVAAIKKIAEEEVKKQRTMDLAAVSSVYPHASQGDNDNYECDVQLKNGGSELRKVPIVTPHIGLTHVPNIGDLVLVGYIGGSVNMPVVLGSLYNGDQRPPANDAGEIIYESPDSQKPGMRRIFLKFPSGIELTIDDDQVKVDTGSATLQMDTKGAASLSNSAGFKLEVNNSGNVKISSPGTVDIEGTVVNIKGSGAVNIN